MTRSSPRQLDDAELDSGDDEGREDRAQHQGDDEEQHQQQFEDHEILSMDVEVARQPVPEPSDGEVSYSCCDAIAFTLTNVDVPIESACFHVHRSRALAGHNFPAPQDRSPLQETRICHILRIQHRHDHDAMAALALGSFSLTIECAYQQMVRWHVDCAACL